MAGIRFGVFQTRAVLIDDTQMIDIETRSGGRFPSGPMGVLAVWDDFVGWARGITANADDPVVDLAALDAPVPAPHAIFGIGLNYRDHAAEAGLDIPKRPMVFTKFPSCITGPSGEIALTSNRCDWEVELVVVIGKRAHKVSVDTAMDHVAGFCAGQDISDRRQQFADKPPQFSLGKSAAGFGPIGPVIVTLDALPDPHDIALHCAIDGELVQSSRTSDMIFSVPELIAYLSDWVTLEPGDLIFTGTPSGVGSVRTPRRYLQAGETITTQIDGIGTMEHTCTEA